MRWNFLWAVALWQSALADALSCSSSVTIASQSDVDDVSKCEAIGGSVTIASSMSGAVTLGSVEEVMGSLTAEGVSGLTSLSAPNLETLHGSLTLTDLGALTELKLSSLAEVKSVVVTGNSNLDSLHFNELEEVRGQLTLTGPFSSVSLPSLDQVNGRTTIEGSQSMSCNALDDLQSDDIYLGGYSCSTSSGDSSLSSVSAGTEGGLSAGTEGGPSAGTKGGLSAGTKGGVAGGVIVGVLLLVLVLWYWLRHRRNKATWKRESPAQATAPGPATVAGEKSPQYQQVPTHQAQPSGPPVPRKPVGSPAAMLDSNSIYEAPIAATPVREYHELDAGPVFGMHQRPIHSESPA